MSITLREDMVEFDPQSVVDPAGVLFHYNHKLYRAIASDHADAYRGILTSNYADELFRTGLVETQIADVGLNGYAMCLEHRRISLVSVWKEWSTNMIKDAALMVLRLNLALAKRGFITKDIQPGNVVFDTDQGPRPVWVDFGSIVPLGGPTGSFPLGAFRVHWMIPLWLMSRGCYDLGKLVFHEQRLDQGMKHLLRRRPLRWLPAGYKLLDLRRSESTAVRLLEALIDYVGGLSIAPRKTEWTRYGQGGMPPVDRPDEFKPKQAAVYRLLERIRPVTMLDMACNKGWFAELAGSLGSETVAFDVDDACICQLYERARKAKLRILPLVMDFCWPTPAFGLGLAKPSADRRLSCVTTLVLALVHHLVFKQGVHFRSIARIVDMYSRRRSIVEFVPRDDQYVRKWIRPHHDWYTLENFIDSLRKHFQSIEVYDSFPEPRKLLLCER